MLIEVVGKWRAVSENWNAKRSSRTCQVVGVKDLERAAGTFNLNYCRPAILVTAL